MDSQIIGAIIGAVALIVAALIGLKIQNNRKHAKIEKQVKAFEHLWVSLNAVDNFLRYELVKKIQEPVVEPSEWTVIFDAVKVLRKEQLLLPAGIFTQCEALFDNLQRNINKLLEIRRKYGNMTKSGTPFDLRQLEDEINNQLAKIWKDYGKNLNDLRVRIDALFWYFRTSPNT